MVDEKISLRLLMIEDNPDDEALIIRSIRKGGFDVEHLRVENRAQLIEALRQQDWDIVLSDYQMPEFNGLNALRTVKERSPDLPFIIVSGTIGEELAVEAMRSGAQDYLMKDNLARLVPAIRRELNDADERRALRLARQTLRHQAYHDILTGLPNRWLLRDRLEQVFAFSRRQHTRPTVMFLDLDRFKNLNDTLGHLLGDQLLRAVADRLREVIAEQDTLARLGGDDFVLLFSDVPDREAALALARRIQARFAQPFRLDGKEIYLDASIGIARYPENGSEPDILIKHAESAMYFAKERGGNSIQFSSDEIQAAAANRFNIENDLRCAIRNDQLEVHYQPQIDLRSGAITGVEALVRWPHPHEGMIAPDRFIPIAEESGLILSLGHWVLQRAMADAVRFKDAGCLPRRLAVNLSARQLYHQETLAAFQDLLAGSPLEERFLEIELTESGVMQNPEQAVANLSALRDLGVSVAIDDFGTGYSSLAYLKRFPIDILKIDRSFVRDLALDQDDEAIIRTIIAMAETLNMRVIAEGIETREQLERLERLGCQEGQGYYFARPLPCAELIRFLQDRACA